MQFSYASNNESSVSAKHVDIKYQVVEARTQDQTISIMHKVNVMDPLRITIQYITWLCCAHGFNGKLLILGMSAIKQPTPIMFMWYPIEVDLYTVGIVVAVVFCWPL